MKTFDGLRLDVQTYGPEDAPLTVLLAHCWMVNQADWMYQVRDLQREFGHGIRIVTWDHRGHGQSDPAPRSACTIENLGRDMGAIVDTYAGPGKLVLAGHSIGGMTMMALAEQRPELFERVVGIALIATSSGRLNTVNLGLPEVGPRLKAQIPRILALRSRTLSKRQRRRAPIIERQFVRRFAFGEPMRLTDAAVMVEGVISLPPASHAGFYDTVMDHGRIDALKVFDGIPTQVLVGTRDVITPPEHGRLLAENIEGAEFTLVPDAGHMLPLERDELITETLARLVRPHL